GQPRGGPPHRHPRHHAGHAGAGGGAQHARRFRRGARRRGEGPGHPRAHAGRPRALRFRRTGPPGTGGGPPRPGRPGRRRRAPSRAPPPAGHRRPRRTHHAPGAVADGPPGLSRSALPLGPCRLSGAPSALPGKGGLMPARSPFVRAVALAALAILIGLLPRFAAAAGTSVRSILRDQPLAFVPNRGQAGPQAQLVARGDGYALALEPTQAVLSLQGAEPSAVLSLRMKVLGGNRAAQPATVSPLPGQSHYLVGNDPAAWRTGLPRYGAVRYDG